MLQYEKRTSKMSNVPPRQRRIFASLQGKKGEKAQETRKIPRNEQSFFLVSSWLFSLAPSASPLPPLLFKKLPWRHRHTKVSNKYSIFWFALQGVHSNLFHYLLNFPLLSHKMILEANVRRDCHFRQIGQTLFKGQGKKILQTAN